DRRRGRGGGPLARRWGVWAGTRGPVGFCPPAAGLGTDHPGGGRGGHHEGLEGGLPPWEGDLTEDLQLELAGGAAAGTVTANPAPRRLTYEEYIRDLLEEEDQVAFDSVAVDPVKVIDVEIRLNRTAAARVHRYLQQLRVHEAARADGVATLDDKVTYARRVHAEHQLRDLAKTLSRLLEVRARYSEMADERRKDDKLREMLRALPQGDFATLRAEPWRLHQYLTPGRN
ncbi:MAG: hypothetical protein R3190_19275, partial [Thermoanaerobaculia bacterium]|nr:hypothetical protein [Thermoanaerobaculia bacterium]